MPEYAEIVVYVGTDRERMRAHADRLGLTEKAADYLSYACSEIAVVIRVDTATGAAKLVGVGRPPLTVRLPGPAPTV